MTDLSQGGAKKLKLKHFSAWKTLTVPLINSLVDLNENAQNDNK